MKNQGLFLTAVFILTFIVPGMQLTAQNKETDKETEKRIQMEIEQQKKAYSDQKKAEEEMLRELREKAIERSVDEIEVMVNVPEPPDVPDFDSENDMVKVFRSRGDRSYYIGEPFEWTSRQGNFHAFTFGDNSQMSRWEFSRNLKEGTFSKEYGFDVEKTAKTVVMSVNGDCKAGEIRIKITMPGGKTYSEILIDESGNLNWRKSFSITENENQDKSGEWKYLISADKATGYFKISLQTN